MKKITYHHESKEIQELIKKDQQLAPLFERKSHIDVHINDDYFVSLVGTITAQQLSSKVAQIIYNRLENLCQQDITAQKIIEFSEEELRAIGLSFQKIKYLKSLAEHMLSNKVSFDHINEMTNDEIIEMLTQIKGIGVWSAQMFLMFSLGREDVFSVLDLGLRNAVKRLYQNENLTHQDIEKLSENWSPYRSIVSHYLWHAWDNDTK
jgi:DNA-3-methyladenine glycosylase II